jgi:predicted Zn finger-like uncharacterized protein
MLITCPKCASSYQLDPFSWSPAGGSVRCTHCGHSWFAANTAAFAAIERVYRAEIAEFSSTLGGRLAGNEVVQMVEASAAMHARVQAAETENSGEGVAINRIAPGQPSPGAAIGHRPRAAGQDVIAEPASLASGGGAMPQRTVTRVLEEVPSRATRRKRPARRQRRWASIGAGAVIPLLIVANLALIGWRADLVHLFPQTASLYATIRMPVNARGIAFADFSATTAPQDAGPALVLNGRLVNVTQRVVRLAQLRFSLRDEAGREVYQWTEPPPEWSLAPGEALPFAARLASPPDRGKEVVVRFLSMEESYSAAMKFPLSAVAAVR